MSSLLIGGEDQRQLLLDALEMGMVSDGYVFIPYDALLYAMPYQVTPVLQPPALPVLPGGAESGLSFSFPSNQDTAFPQLSNSTQLRHAYSSVLTVTMASEQSFYEAFREMQINREIRSAVAVTQVTLLVADGLKLGSRSVRVGPSAPSLHTNADLGRAERSEVISIGRSAASLCSAGVSALRDHLQHGLFYCQVGGGAAPGGGRALGHRQSAGPLGRRL